MYQDFFNLKDFPFSQFPSIDYYFNLENHQESLDVLNVGLEVNDGIIKITGRSGTGKSLLCRLFVDKIADCYHPVYILNPYFNFSELLQYILADLQVEFCEDDTTSQLTKALYTKALELKKQGKKLVLLFDESQYISRDGLEAIQIISNFECEGEKLCQIVIVGGLDLDDKLVGFQHFLQRISFSYTLNPMTREDVESYIYHRLAKAANGAVSHGISFTPSALYFLYKKTQGIPRLINIVCHKSLMLAYSLGTRQITKSIVKKAVADTESVAVDPFWKKLFKIKKKYQSADNLITE